MVDREREFTNLITGTDFEIIKKSAPISHLLPSTDEGAGASVPTQHLLPPPSPPEPKK